MRHSSSSSGSHERLLVFSGGTAFNSIARALSQRRTKVTYILPVTDDGGSTAKIARVVAGPAIGDIRSRLLRLAALDTEEQRAIVGILQYRLPKISAEAARMEWLAIIETQHALWDKVSEPIKAMIRSFLLHFNAVILQTVGTVREDGRKVPAFDFCDGSIGNFFFTGARLFFGSLRAATLLWGYIAGVPEETHVFPVVNPVCTLQLGAQLSDGQTLIGQTMISYGKLEVDKEQDGHGKSLPGRVERLFYVTADGTPTKPALDNEARNDLMQAAMVVYGIGSLLTSLGASLIAVGVGRTLAGLRCRKVLMLNGTYDRETLGLSAIDIVDTVSRWCLSDCDEDVQPKATAFVTDLIYLEAGEIQVDAAAFGARGINCHGVPSDASQSPFKYDIQALLCVLDALM